MPPDIIAPGTNTETPVANTPTTFNINPALSTEQQQQLLTVLNRNREAFAPNPIETPPPAHGVEHVINLHNPSPVKQHPTRHSEPHNQYISENVERLLKHGLIRHSSSAWASPIVLARKPNNELRMCIDYRKVNAQTIKDAYPMPVIEDCLDLCKDAKWYSALDIQEAYYQVPMETKSIPLTAFVTKDGFYEWLVMPFGLTNAPATFQRYIDSVMRPVVGKCCAAYFDDVLCYTAGTFEQHLADLENILQLLIKAGLHAKARKCKFGYPSVTFLGHVVKDGKIYADPEKTRVVTEWPAPTNIIQLRQFLGLANYYRRFVNGFAVIAAPLYELLKKKSVWNWHSGANIAFERLKAALTSSPCLRPPDYSKPFIVQTDASGVGISGILAQRDDEGNEHPIHFVSRQLCDAEKNYHATEQECLAVVWTIQQFEKCLLGNSFTVYTDNSALQSLPTKKFTTKRIMRWALALTQYSFTIHHRAGKHNSNADALSRQPPINSAPDQPLDRFPPTLPRCINCVRDPSSGTCITCTRAIHSLRQNNPDNLASSESTAPPAATQGEPEEVAIRQTRSKSDTPHDEDNTISLGKRKHKSSRQYPPPQPPLSGDTEHSASPLDMTLYAFMDDAAVEEILQAQHTDEVTSNIIGFIRSRTVPANLNTAAARSFRQDCRNYILDINYTPPALFRVPQERRHSLLQTRPRLYIPRTFRTRIIEQYHSNIFAGHLGITRTWSIISRDYYWPSCYEDVHHYIIKCEACALTKAQRKSLQRPTGIMQPPMEPFELVSMDFIDLQAIQSADFKYVLVFVDHFSRFTIAIPCIASTAETTARIFFTHVICQYGCPRRLLSDRGSHFENELITTLAQHFNIKKLRTSAYHPQANGVVERHIGFIKSILHSTCKDNPHAWSYCLPAAVFAINNAPSELLGFSPFFILFGRNAVIPNAFLSSQNPEPHPNSADEAVLQHVQLYLQEQQDTYNMVTAKLNSEIDKKQQHNKTLTSVPQFKAGDHVLLTNQGTKRRGNKDPYKGEFIIQRRLSSVIYEISPASRKTNRKPLSRHIVHVERLRRFDPPIPQRPLDPPLQSDTPMNTDESKPPSPSPPPSPKPTDHSPPPPQSALEKQPDEHTAMEITPNPPQPRPSTPILPTPDNTPPSNPLPPSAPQSSSSPSDTIETQTKSRTLRDRSKQFRGFYNENLQSDLNRPGPETIHLSLPFRQDASIPKQTTQQ